MNCMHDLSTGITQKYSDMWTTMAGNCRRFISCYFMHFLNKLNFKNTIRHIRIYIQCTIQNRLNLSFSTRGFVLIFLNILIWLLEVNNDLKYFIHVGRVLTREVEGAVTLPLLEICFGFKLQINCHKYLFCFPHSFISNTEWIIYWKKLDEWSRTQAKYGN